MLALSEINNWQEGANSKLIEYLLPISILLLPKEVSRPKYPYTLQSQTYNHFEIGKAICRELTVTDSHLPVTLCTWPMYLW